MKTLKVEMIHDVVCSWCPIGYRNMQAALGKLDVKVDFRFLPYELNPQLPAEGEAIASYFKGRFGWSDQKLTDYQSSLVKTARDAGVNIDFSKRTHYYNTKKAHKLLHWAEGFNKQVVLNEMLIKAYFEQGLNIDSTQALLDIAELVELDREAAETALMSPGPERKFDNKVARVKQMEPGSIPAFILNDRLLIRGSKSVPFFEEVLSKMINEQVAV